MNELAMYSEQFVERAEYNYRYRIFSVDGSVFVHSEEWEETNRRWADKGEAAGIPKIDLKAVVEAMLKLLQDDID